MLQQNKMDYQSVVLSVQWTMCRPRVVLFMKGIPNLKSRYVLEIILKHFKEKKRGIEFLPYKNIYNFISKLHLR